MPRLIMQLLEFSCESFASSQGQRLPPKQVKDLLLMISLLVI
jgi:hypothetical protein